MKFNDYQTWAVSKNMTKEQYDILGSRLKSHELLQLTHSALGIAGESGELVGAIKKTILYDQPLDRENVKEEIGDILWYVALLLETIGSNFDEVATMNFNKLEKRYPSGYTNELAKLRLDKVETGETNEDRK
jgi:NTP pyrophosphatase (non-canonical NTP hydrolase)